MQSPLPTLALCIFYAYFCKSLAPRLMENRKPFGLRKTLIFYNLFQTVFSAWIFYEVSRLWTLTRDFEMPERCSCVQKISVKYLKLIDSPLLPSICKADGCETTATGVNLWITLQKDFGWRRPVGGITSPNSPSSSILCSSSCERNINMSRRSTWFIMAWCLSAVSEEKTLVWRAFFIESEKNLFLHFQSGWEWSLPPAATQHSSQCLTPLFTSSCTSTIWSLLWARNTKSTFGGRST